MSRSGVHLRHHAASMRLKTRVENHPGFLYAVMGLFYGMPGSGPASGSSTGTGLGSARPEVGIADLLPPLGEVADGRPPRRCCLRGGSRQR